MISGILIRNFKIYRGINYIPLSNGTNFCGLIGQNGIGKSSVLEALDCYFNNKKWNRNMDSINSESSYVMPVFIFEGAFFEGMKEDDISFIKNYSDSIKNFISNDIPSTINQQRRNCWIEIKQQHASIDITNKFIIPILFDENKNVNFGICDEDLIIKDLFSEEYRNLGNDNESKKDRRSLEYENLCQCLTRVYTYIIEKMTYVYVPKDIEPERFVKFETEEIQHLIGADLIDVVKKSLTENQIKQISTQLREFVDDLSDKLQSYKFVANGVRRQPNLKSKDIYDLIINDFFAKRILVKENPGKDIPLSQLSSGEKQQAILSFIYSIVSNYRDNNKNLIIAIDEPESALHISLCYDQFERLHKISHKCCQVLFSSHWYGFIPAITDGVIINITQKDNRHIASVFSINKYREEIKNAIRTTNGKLPIEISLKGVNDLIQSIISSVINEGNSYNWLICEGSSDKIYLNHYLQQEVNEKKLRIVPVGGANEVRKIFEHLKLAFNELKGSLKGRVFLLLDTDENFLSFDSKCDHISNLRCNRLINIKNDKETHLVENESNPKSPKTDIEDVLNGKAFNEVLLTFKENNEELSFVDDNEKSELPSFFSLDLRPSDYESLDKFFSNNNGDNKVCFAKKYVEELERKQYAIPSWIEEIKAFFNEK